MKHTTEIKINNKVYPLEFNTLAIRKFADMRGIEFVDQSISQILDIAKFKTDDQGKIMLDESGNPIMEQVKWSGIDAIIDFIYCALIESARRQKITVEITREDLYSLMDEPDGLTSVLQVITGSMPIPDKENKENFPSPEIPG